MAMQRTMTSSGVNCSAHQITLHSAIQECPQYCQQKDEVMRNLVHSLLILACIELWLLTFRFRIHPTLARTQTCSTAVSGRANLESTMLHCTRLPHVVDARMAALVPSFEEETSSTLPTHAENELSAFEASSRRRKATNNKLAALGTGICRRSRLVMSPVLFSADVDFGFGFLCPGAESSWPHGCGRRPVSEPSFASTHALPASVASNSLAWASDSTVAAVLRTRTSQGLRSSMTPSMLSSIGSSTSLQSRSQVQVPGRMSAVPVSWQV